MDKYTEEETVLEHESEELEIGGCHEVQIYPMDGIKVEKGFYTVFELKRRYEAPEKRIILDSEFQRADVWNSEKKAELVESVLMGLPLPIFYFNQDKYGRLIVVDGRQRLTALFQFMENKFALRGIKILVSLRNKKFSELSPVLQTRIEDFQIQAHVILPPTPDRIKFDIFDRVNRGGMQLNKQEIRNALYQGNATLLLKQIVESKEFAAATGNAFVNEKRMKDKYLVTRFIAFYLYRSGKIHGNGKSSYIYRDDIDELLGRGMDTLNAMNPDQLQELKQIIIAALNKSEYYLGGDAFRIRTEGRRSPVNMNVFEAIMFIMQEITEKREEARERVRSRIFEWIHSDEFKNNIGNHRDAAVRVNWRLDYAQKLGKALNCYDR